LLEVAGRLARSPHGQLPVVDTDGTYLGIVTARAAADALADGRHDRLPVGGFVEQAQTVRADTTLDAGLDALESAAGTAIPVLDESGRQVIGWLSHQRVLSALSAAGQPGGSS
jgi:CIC family chloride channel protein